MSARELIPDPEFLEQLLDTPLIYNQSNGTDELRATIAAHLSGRHAGQRRGHQRRQRGQFRFDLFHARAGRRGRHHSPQLPADLGPDPTAWAWRSRKSTCARTSTGRPTWPSSRPRLSPRTRMIVVCNPNNPDRRHPDRGRDGRDRPHRGPQRRLDSRATRSTRDRSGDGRTTPTFWGKYDRVIVTNGLSKAYGLPGLRIGWIVAPTDLIARMWSYHDYTTIAPGHAERLPGPHRALAGRAQPLPRAHARTSAARTSRSSGPGWRSHGSHVPHGRTQGRCDRIRALRSPGQFHRADRAAAP